MPALQSSIAPGSTPHAQHSYLLASDEPEAERLRSQHKYVVELYENRIVLAPVRLNVGNEVLDIGTGSGAWALDLVENFPTADKVSVICIDIGTHFFPKDYPSNMIFKEGSVLALPAEWEHKFSLVHQRLLIAGLKYDEWPIATKEIFRVTTPGGWVQLCEVYSVGTACGPHSAKCVEMVQLLYAKTGLDTACTKRIPTLLSEAGFIDVRVEPRQIKCGHWGGEMGIRCAKNLLSAWSGLKTHVLRAGGFGLVKNEEDFDKLMDGVKDEWETQSGAEFGWFIFVGKKPE